MERIAIVDNAPHCRQFLTDMVNRYASYHGERFELDTYEDSASFLERFALQYDILIIDAGLRDVNGIEVMRRVRQVDQAVEVIYVAFTDDYVLDGYEVGALSYILKPPTYDQLEQGMDRCLNALRNHANQAIGIIAGGKEQRVRADEILYASSHKHRTILHMITGNQQILCSMVRFEERLAEVSDDFFRINSGYLVNMDHVTSIEDHDACMSNGDRLPISRPRRAEFRKAWSRHIGMRRRRISWRIPAATA